MEKVKSDLYAIKHKMYVATDCIIFGFDDGNLKLLIFKRNVAPLRGEWSLIGSFVKLNEDVASAAKRVLEEITGLKNVFLEQLKTYGAVDRDPGFRVISVAHTALIRINDYDRQLVKEFGASWHDIDDLPPLILDHDRMVKDALKKLRRRARYQPLGFELLPEKFSIPQLQRLYEAIYQKELDSRNFRKKLLSLKVLQKLDEKDKTNSKRGAFLYRFDREKYEKKFNSKFNFEI